MTNQTRWGIFFHPYCQAPLDPNPIMNASHLGIDLDRLNR